MLTEGRPTHRHPCPPFWVPNHKSKVKNDGVYTGGRHATPDGEWTNGFGIGLGPVPGLLPAELFPAAQRSSGSGLAWSAMWLSNFISAQLFLPQAAWLGTQAFVPNLVVLCVAFGFAYFSVPETRGKSLEQIEREMSAT